MTNPTGKPRGRPRKDDTTRTDGAYSNVFLSTNNSRDRGSYTRHATTRILGSTELEQIYIADGFARKIIDLPAEEMTRCGFEVEGIDDEGVESAFEVLKAVPKVIDALKWAGLFGGAVIVMLLNDGGEFTDPLTEDSVKDFEAIRVYDRWQVTRARKYDDPADKRYGNTMIYQINPASGAAPYQVHETRCIVVDGIQVPDRIREQNDGWGNSKLQHCYDQLVRAGMSHYWANSLLERAQQAVHGIPGLTNILRSPGGEQLVRTRLDLVDMSRSINNAVAIDGEERYEILSTSFAGVPDIIDRLGQALCAVADIPEQLLFGRQQTGMGNNGASGLESWYAKIGALQETILLPIIDRLVTLVLKAQGKYSDQYSIEFKPMWVPSEKEKAETDNLEAKTAEIYINAGALDPSELRAKIADEYEIDNVELMPEMPDANDPADVAE